VTRVVIVHRGWLPALTGATNMALAAAAQLRLDGLDVSVVAHGGQDFCEHGTLRGVPALLLADPDTAQVAELLPRADIVHALDLSDLAFASMALQLARRWGAPFVLTPASALETWPDRKAGAQLCRAADAVVVHTDAEAAVMARLGADPVRLVRTAQGAQLADNADANGLRDRHRLDGPFVLFLGRKTRSKGYDRLLRAADGLWRGRPDVRIVLAGPPWDDDVEDVLAAHADPRIADLGEISESDKLGALLACEAVCVPTTVDVAPLVFAEAWSCGRPVITCRFPGAEELVGDKGLVAGTTPQELAAAILAVLDDRALRARLERDAGAHAARSSWAAITLELRRVYGRLLARSPPSAAVCDRVAT